MAINYTKAAATALKLLSANGRPVTLVKINRTPSDPNKPWEGSDNTPDTTVTATAVFVDPVSEKDLGRNLKRGPTDGITKGFQIAFISAAENPGVDLSEYDRMIDNGVVYTVDEIDVLKPGNTILMYEFRVRR